MATGPMPQAGLPPRNFGRTYQHYQLAGHSPRTPWWATFLAIGLILGASLLFIAWWRLR